MMNTHARLGRTWKRLQFLLGAVGVAMLGNGQLVSGAGLEDCLLLARRMVKDTNAVPPALWRHPKPHPWTRTEKTPVAGMVVLARESSGAVWLGSDQGAARFEPKASERWERWRYYYGRRWFPDDRIEHIVVEEPSGDTPLRAWIRTRGGVACLEWKRASLEGKARRFDERIEARHVRHGLVASVRLERPGDLASFRQQSSDNDGLWTSIYLAAQCYRYAVTHDPAARRRAQRALRAIMHLEAVTGIPGFYARSVVPIEQEKPAHGEWHRSRDGRWWWKGDTSSDESVGHYYAYSTYFDLVADQAEKEAIRKVVARMTDYLIDHGYELLDVDGKPTRWGRWSEAYYRTEEGHYEAALRSLELLSFLKTTWHITGQAKYQAAYEDRVRRGYARHMRYYRRWPGGGEINFSDDELAYLSYAPLLKYEQDPELRKIYLDGLRFTWSQVRPDRNPLWNYISVASGAGPMTPQVRYESRLTLQRIPEDMITWTVRNSHRQDIVWRWGRDRSGTLQLAWALAPDERRVAKWNSNPYLPDGGDGGRSEDDGSYFLLPYWMGRYHGWIK